MQMSAKVLIVDDSVFIRNIISDAVEKMGLVKAGEAVDVEDAVEQYMKTKADIVTMDIHMPSKDGKKSGIDACRVIKQINPDAIVIMVTALGHRKSVIEAIKAGASDYLVKPLNKEKVTEIINKVMKQ
jgi:two-component system, chemotaxis family, chemotaxis protein CheY